MDSWEERGITFVEEPPGPDALTREAALEALKSSFAPNAVIEPSSCRYGRMCAKRPAVGRVGEKPVPIVWDRLVWVITIPDRVLPRGGGRGRPQAHTTPQPLHVVLDGLTGERLFAFSP